MGWKWRSEGHVFSFLSFLLHCFGVIFYYTLLQYSKPIGNTYTVNILINAQALILIIIHQEKMGGQLLEAISLKVEKKNKK